ncbi:MAG: YdcF family protein, partial [Betaproteobacteria bacterium]|nr:YdcF family protein [Betaproteobacteria bacterium]
MSCLRRCALFLFCLLLLGAAALAGTAWFASDWLVRADPPVRSNAIVVLSGDFQRVFHGAQLYRMGMAPQVIITAPRREAGYRKLDEIGVPSPRQEQLSRDALVRLGVPDSAIRTVGNELHSTAAEAAVIRDALAPGSTLLIVTSPYHTRRAGLVFAERFPAPGIRMLPDPGEPLPRRWWTDQDAARKVLMEFAKTLFFLA